MVCLTDPILTDQIQDEFLNFFRNTIRFHQWGMLFQFPSMAAEILDTNELSAMTITDHFHSSCKS